MFCPGGGTRWMPDALQAEYTMRFGSTAKLLPECKLKYYRISACNNRGAEEGGGNRPAPFLHAGRCDASA